VVPVDFRYLGLELQLQWQLRAPTAICLGWVGGLLSAALGHRREAHERGAPVVAPCAWRDDVGLTDRAARHRPDVGLVASYVRRQGGPSAADARKWQISGRPVEDASAVLSDTRTPDRHPPRSAICSRVVCKYSVRLKSKPHLSAHAWQANRRPVLSARGKTLESIPLRHKAKLDSSEITTRMTR
jgi:hypothetical protein